MFRADEVGVFLCTIAEKRLAVWDRANWRKYMGTELECTVHSQFLVWSHRTERGHWSQLLQRCLAHYKIPQVQQQ